MSLRTISTALSFSWALSLAAAPAASAQDTTRAAVVAKLDDLSHRLDSLSREIAALRDALNPGHGPAMLLASTEPAAEAPALDLPTKTSGCVAHLGLPDHACTPGKLMTTDLHIICGQSTKERRNVPTALKKQVAEAYGLTYPETAGMMEIDHLIPLALGGDNDAANLWPEIASPTPGFHEKDKVELNLHNRVCDGEVSLNEAVQIITGDWKKYYKQMNGTH